MRYKDFTPDKLWPLKCTIFCTSKREKKTFRLVTFGYLYKLITHKHTHPQTHTSTNMYYLRVIFPNFHVWAAITVKTVVLDDEQHIKQDGEEAKPKLCRIPEDGTPIICKEASCFYCKYVYLFTSF